MEHVARIGDSITVSDHVTTGTVNAITVGVSEATGKDRMFVYRLKRNRAYPGCEAPSRRLRCLWFPLPRHRLRLGDLGRCHPWRLLRQFVSNGLEYCS